jgi:hypothetical protein
MYFRSSSELKQTSVRLRQRSLPPIQYFVTVQNHICGILYQHSKNISFVATDGRWESMFPVKFLKDYPNLIHLG